MVGVTHLPDEVVVLGKGSKNSIFVKLIREFLPMSLKPNLWSSSSANKSVESSPDFMEAWVSCSRERTTGFPGVAVVPVREHLPRPGSVSSHARCGESVAHDGGVCRAIGSKEQDAEEAPWPVST